jgi:quinol monooxygenase YgiN
VQVKAQRWRQGPAENNCAHRSEGAYAMDKHTSLVVEWLVAKADRVDALKRWLQLAAEEIRSIPGVRQLELMQNCQNPAEFVFFLVVEDIAQAAGLLDRAEWHKELVQALPDLLLESPERVVGTKVA